MSKQEQRQTPEKVRSDAANVKRLLADLDERKRKARTSVNPMRTRRYVNGPHANPGWVCQGGLPSLGEGY